MPSELMLNILVRMPMPVREYWIERYGRRSARELADVGSGFVLRGSTDAFEHYVDAMILLSRGRQPSGSRARTLLATALYLRARMLYTEHKFTSALNCIEESLALTTVATGCTVTAGAACWALGRFDESIRYSDRALELLNSKKDDTGYHIVLARSNKAVALVELGRFEEAVDITKPEHNPHWPDSLYLLEVTHAWALMHAGEIDRADQAFKELDAVISTAREVSARRYYQYRAKHYLNLGLTSNALADLNHVLNTFGPSPLCLMLLTEASLRAGDRSAAEMYANDMQSTYPDAFHTTIAQEILGAKTELV